MARHNLTDEDIFSSTGTNQRPDPDIYQAGHQAIDDPKYWPKPENFNWFWNMLTNNVQYLLRHSASPWDAEEVYPVGSRVYIDDKTYLSLKESTGKTPSNNTDYWQYLEDSDSPATAKPLLKTDLNTLNTHDKCGFYHQDSDINIPGNNYPSSTSGSLLIQKGATGVTQIYIDHYSGQMHVRAYFNNVWTDWRTNYDTSNKPTASDVGAISTDADETFVHKAGKESISGEKLFSQPISTPEIRSTDESFIQRTLLKIGEYTDDNGDLTEIRPAGASSENVNAGIDVFTKKTEIYKPHAKTAQETSASALLRYDYFASVLANQTPKQATPLGTVDLNTLKSFNHTGFYHQTSDASTIGNNYPSSTSGSLLIQKGATGVTQIYIEHYSGQMFVRAYFNNVWKDWRRIYDSDNTPDLNGRLNDLSDSNYGVLTTLDGDISRAVGTTYTNDTIANIYVSIYGLNLSSSGSAVTVLVANKNIVSRTMNNNYPSDFNFVVPPGATYSIVGSAYQISNWAETRHVPATKQTKDIKRK